jgi:uncharacterized protein
MTMTRSASVLSRRRFTMSVAVAPLLLAQYGNAKPKQPAAANEITGKPVLAGEPVSPKVRPFAAGRVQLLDGPFKDAQTWNTAFMKRQSPDRLLHVFRVNAGIPSSAKPLGGWEKPDSEIRGHFVGHYLSACALLYASTGDAEIKQRADHVVSVLAKCQKKLNFGGYLSAFPLEFFDRLDARKNVWVPFYTYHKIMAGLLDMYTLAGNAQALNIVAGMAAWTDKWTAARTPEHMQDILTTEYGGMNEVLYDLAAVTGDARWLKVGDRFNKAVFFDPLAARHDALKGLHMNTHVPQVIGAARRFELSGDHRYGEIARFFWDTVVDSRTYVTGGSSNREHWLTEPYQLGAEWRQDVNHQECCCSYNMLKLSRHLFSLAANEKYIAYYERNLFNHRLGTIEPNSGNTTYFLSMAPGAWKTLATDDASFWCCTGTAMEEFAKLADTIYFHDDDGLYVNLFIASRMDWPERGLLLEQETHFPVEPKTTLTIRRARAGNLAIHLRVPAWSPQARVTINGRPLDVIAEAGSYMKISRNWQVGDTVDLELPMQLHSEGFADAPQMQALLVGPIVLAGQFPKGQIPDALMHEQGPQIAKLPPLQVPRLVTGGKPLETVVKPAGGSPLTYVTENQPQNVMFKPLNQSWERFAVYWETV